MERIYWLYILASRTRRTYVGVTGDLAGRIYQHRIGKGSLHARRYRIRRLVYAESFPTAWDAIAAEKRVKGWSREKKLRLIESRNPDWRDLFEDE